MLSLFLNIIGIALILYSIYIIKKDIGKVDLSEEVLSESHKRELDYYQASEESIDQFDDVMDAKIQITKIKESQIQKNLEKDEIHDDSSVIIKEKEIVSQDDYGNPLHKKIIELKSIGLTNEDIAKKLAKGVREIDIILRMYKGK